MNTQWLNIIGLVLDIIGAGILFHGLIIGKKSADKENLKLPQVKDRMKQSRNAIIGLIFLTIGLILQIIANWPTDKTQTTAPTPEAQMQTQPSEIQPSQTTQDSANDWKVYSSEKYGFEFKYPSSQCLLSQDQPGGLFVELYQNGKCPTMQERGDLGTLTFKYNYDFINTAKSDLPLSEYIKKEFSNIKSQKSISINNINWEAIYLDCDTEEGEAPVCYGINIFYISKNIKNDLIYSIGSQDESSAEKIAKEWINLSQQNGNPKINNKN